MDSDARANNPAYRLKHLFEALKETERKQKRRMAAFGEALGARSNEPWDVLPLFFEASKLPDQVEAAFEAAGVANPAPYLKDLNAWRSFFDFNSMAGGWGPG